MGRILVLPSRPGEFRPEPLTEPDVSLSTYPARATTRRLPPSIEYLGFLPSPVDPISKAMACPLRSTGITPLHHYKETALRRHCVRWPKYLGSNQFIDFDAKAFHSLWVGKAGGELLQRNSLAQALRSLA